MSQAMSRRWCSRAGIAVAATTLVACSTSTSPGAVDNSTLWIVGGNVVGANIANRAAAFQLSQLRASNSPSSGVMLSFPTTVGNNIDATADAVDASGNLWIANDNSNTVVGLTPAQLGVNGSPTPAGTLTGPAINTPYALAFDSHGNLWVGNNVPGTIVEFTPAQLIAGGTPTPIATLTDTVQGGSAEPGGLAFDSAGNLWVTNNPVSMIVKYPVGQLHTGGVATVTISGSGLDWPEEIAFDSHGNLWVANTAVDNGNGSIVEFPASALGASGSPTPAVTLRPPGAQFGPIVTGVAFDATGDLWYTELSSYTVGEYTTAQLAAGGNPTPVVHATIPDSLAPVGLSFYPRAKRLP